jgi:hypothetical protein
MARDRYPRVLAIVGREGRSAVFGLPPKGATLGDPGAELTRRFLRAYGPARPKLLADWAGLATSHAKALWERAGPLVSVDVDGTKAWALAADRSALTNHARPDSVRLLANPDPLNAGRDRELLVPDVGLRKRIWTALGGPGTVLVSGEVAGLWRSAKRGKRLLVTVEPLDKLTTSAKDELAAEAERIAPFRGADAGELRLATL